MDREAPRRGSWLFRVLIGSPRYGHLAGAYLWISLATVLIGSSTALLLHSLSPVAMKISRIASGQLLVAFGLALLLPDVLLFSVRSIPFTHLHKSSVNDLPLAVLRYLVLFPLFVSILVAKEAWIEASVTHLLATTILFLGTHLFVQRAQASLLAQYTLDTPPDDADEFPQKLGLRDC